MKKSTPRQPKASTTSDKKYNGLNATVAQPLSAQVPTRSQARKIMKLHDDGWTPEEISGLVRVSVAHVRRTIAREIERAA